MEQEEYLKSRVNRVEKKVSEISSLRDPEDMMIELMSILKDTSLVPEVGRYYTFIYTAKTPRIEYDQHPLIACIGIFNWGFRGLNYHWGDFRNYTWEEVSGSLYNVYPMEVNDMRSIPYQLMRMS